MKSVTFFILSLNLNPNKTNSPPSKNLSQLSLKFSSLKSSLKESTKKILQDLDSVFNNSSFLSETILSSSDSDLIKNSVLKSSKSLIPIEMVGLLLFNT